MYVRRRFGNWVLTDAAMVTGGGYLRCESSVFQANGQFGTIPTPGNVHIQNSSQVKFLHVHTEGTAPNDMRLDACENATFVSCRLLQQIQVNNNSNYNTWYGGALLQGALIDATSKRNCF